jgi:hypothetical protein
VFDARPQVIEIQTQTTKSFVYLVFLPKNVEYLGVALKGEESSMNLFRTVFLAAIGLGALVVPASAGLSPAPGPIAGIGLPALALVGGAYWVGRKLFARKK